jgi:DivIVA domain-containing protein
MQPEVHHVALDRQSIEKKDFPVGRRGYDPDAVDTHLSALADEIAEYKRTARRRSDTLASSASEQVRAIVEAAETSASEIQRDAEADAKEIREEANNEAQATREQATAQAREYVGNVSESTDGMLKRLDSMQTELDGLIEQLRSGSNRLGADLKLLQSNLTEMTNHVSPVQFEPEPEPEPAAPLAAVAPVAEEPSVGEDDDDDAEGARLIALNMALNGTPREETAKYLEENFSLADAGNLLDEVYASVEG